MLMIISFRLFTPLAPKADFSQLGPYGGPGTKMLENKPSGGFLKPLGGPGTKMLKMRVLGPS